MRPSSAIPFVPALLIGLLLFATPLRAQNGSDAALWQETKAASPNRPAHETWVRPKAFRTFHLQHSQLRPLLNRAPREGLRPAKTSDAIISLPQPDGTQARFRFVESPVMPAELAARFPEIKTYLGRGVDDPTATVRFDLTPAGFHAQILSPQGAVYIEPYLRGNTNVHAVYARRDYEPAAPDFQCLAASPLKAAAPAGMTPLAVTGSSMRTYRLACAATAEYTAYFGGTVSAGLAAVVTAVNRVTGIYESELGIRLVLAVENDKIIYTNSAAQPYSNGSPSALLSQNQANLDSVIGGANYDVGHVFSTGGGGLAVVGVVCVAGLKAQGETGTYPPVGDAFYVDYVAHEMGHQFGASHTFNSSLNGCGYGNRVAETAFEPGSGSTIMSYAGICSTDNLQYHSGAYFHSTSLGQVLAYTTSGAGNTPAALGGAANNPPTVNAGMGYTIPMGTPFTLTAVGSDPDGDPLTYCWEEHDLGPSLNLSAPDNGSSPLFRSFNPTTNPERTFPQVSDILNRTTTAGEKLPTTSRTMTFRVTARDNSANGGASAFADTQVTVSTNAGPFVVTVPASSVTWSNTQTIGWDVAGTTNAPVSAASVNILLSTNGGLTFPIVLASNVPNNGTRSVLLPLLTTSAARIKVQAAANVFFAISPVNFSIVPTANPTNYPPTLAPIASRTIHAGSVLTVTNSATDPAVPCPPLAFSLDPGAPSGAAISPTTGALSWITTPSCACSTNTITVRVTQTSSPYLSDAKSFTVIVAPTPTLQPLRFSNGSAQFTWNAVPGQSYRVQHKPTLAATNWTDLVPDITATGPTVSVADTPGSVPQGYYRIVALP